MTRYVRSSLTRRADLDDGRFFVSALPRAEWATGDFVAAEVTRAHGPLASIELPTGRMASVAVGDQVIGALGRRAATLEVVGDWAAIGPDLNCHALTSAGLIGLATSCAKTLPPLLGFRYRGHLVSDDAKRTMSDPLVRVPAVVPLETPTVLLIGSSMSAGKTTAAKVVIRLLAQQGRRVVGAKLTGAGRYQDILAMADSGADAVFDFVDVGLPSTVCRPEHFRQCLGRLFGLIVGAKPDVVVAEAGASPLEPYNGRAVVEALTAARCFTVLCASDPYAAKGVMDAFGLRPDVIAGLATGTEAGIALTRALTGVTALNMLDPHAVPPLRAALERCLGPA